MLCIIKLLKFSSLCSIKIYNQKIKATILPSMNNKLLVLLSIIAKTLLSTRSLTIEFQHPNLRSHLPQDPDTKYQFKGMCKNHNYNVQEHKVTTDDGYILTMFRIPTSPKVIHVNQYQKKSVVFMQHGILDSSDTFINNGPDLAPAYILADAGFDVWLGNSRGSFYSRQHVNLNPDQDSQYWQFSFEKMGLYDITAEVQYILDYTGVDKLTYIGHSQGTTQMFLSLTQNIRWWRKRIFSFVALGPVCKVHNAQSTILQTLSYIPAQYLLNLAGVNQILPRDYYQNKILSIVCQYSPIACSIGMYFISDSDLAANSPEKMQVFIAHYPSGTSLMSIDHYAQLILNHNFAKYDYGQSINLQVYGQKQPPAIDIGKIKDIPIALIIGNHDTLATVQDNQWIKQNLGENSLKMVKYIDGGHLTFMLGKDAEYLKDVINFIKENQSISNIQSQDQ